MAKKKQENETKTFFEKANELKEKAVERLDPVSKEAGGIVAAEFVAMTAIAKDADNTVKILENTHKKALEEVKSESDAKIEALENELETTRKANTRLLETTSELASNITNKSTKMSNLDDDDDDDSVTENSDFFDKLGI